MSWAVLASTKLNDAVFWCGNPGAPAPPNCLPTSLTGGGNNIRVSSIGGAWGTGCFDTVRGEIVFPRLGGHADWAGNQVIAFKPGTGWAMKRNASTAYPPMSQTGTFTSSYSDGSPASVHSYGAVAYLPSVDRMWSGGGIYWSPGGSSDGRTWWFDPVNFDWEPKSTRPGGYGCAAVWDPQTQHLIVRISNNGLSYDPATDVYTTLFTQSGAVASGSTMAINASDRKVYRLSAGLKMIDLNNLSLKEQSLASTGGPTDSEQGLIYADNRLIATGPSSVAGRLAIYTADVANKGGVGQPAVQWVRDAVDANEPPNPATGTGHTRVWNNFFGPLGGKYYVVLHSLTTDVYEYTPSWAVDTITLDVPSAILLEVL